jgi:hypothetical protein
MPENRVKCPCRNCKALIEFDANQLGVSGHQTAKCPHCHQDTVLFVPEAVTRKGRPVLEPIERTQISIPNLAEFEQMIFWITRKFAVFWAGVVLLATGLFIIGFIIGLFSSDKTAGGGSPQGMVLLIATHPKIAYCLEFFVVISFLLAILTCISTVLVLFAIERNTRQKSN